MNTIETHKSRKGYIGSLLTCIFFIFAGLMTLYDTTSYTDVDSKVFPRAVAIILIICSMISLMITVIKKPSEGGFGYGIWWRRIILVITMLLTCFAMPYVGFLAASTIAFCGGLIAAMHDSWTAKTAMLYAAIGIVVMTAFYLLFRYALHVPLP